MFNILNVKKIISKTLHDAFKRGITKLVEDDALVQDDAVRESAMQP